MIKRIVMILLFCALCCSWQGMSGCSKKDDKPPPKKTIDKLNSSDRNEQKEGLDEADRKYGGGK